jgi:transmembrane sensor
MHAGIVIIYLTRVNLATFIKKAGTFCRLMSYINMKREENKTIYEFLENEAFVRWIKNPEGESDEFWKNYAKNNPDKIEKQIIAEHFLRSLFSYNKRLSDGEAEEIWHKIGQSNRKYLRRRILSRYFYAAASIVLILAAGWWLLMEKSPQENLYDYVSLIPVDPGTKQVTLILADDSELAFDDRETTLTYDDKGNLNVDLSGSEKKMIVQSQPEVEKQETVVTLNRVIVPYGRRASITLSDNSRIWLNSGSMAIYPTRFPASGREIFLQGEAFIEVPHMINHPFIVKTHHMEIVVTGTSFNVSAYPDDPTVSVVLAEGSICARLPETRRDMKLEPNQMLTYSVTSGQLVVDTEVDVLEFTSWKEGWLLCINEGLPSLFTRLARYYNLDIIMNRTDAGSYSLSGKLDLKDDFKEVLDVISRTLPIEYEFLEENKFVVSIK